MKPTIRGCLASIGAVLLIFAGCSGQTSEHIVQVTISWPEASPYQMKELMGPRDNMLLYDVRGTRAVTSVCRQGQLELYLQSKPGMDRAQFQKSALSAVVEWQEMLPAQTDVQIDFSPAGATIPIEEPKEISVFEIALDREKLESYGNTENSIASSLSKSLEEIKNKDVSDEEKIIAASALTVDLDGKQLRLDEIAKVNITRQMDPIVSTVDRRD